MNDPFGQEYSGGSSAAMNPYAPTELVSDPVSESSDERIRQRHLAHESSIKGIGGLFMLGGVLLLLISGVGLMAAISGRPDSGEAMILSGVYLFFGIFQFWVGRGLRAFDSVARRFGILLSALGLLFIPIGTLINGYFLYLLCGKKGRFVFSPDYARIRAATPNMRYRTSIGVWILLAVIIVAILVLVGWAAFVSV
jgi:hypothetical protein